VRDKEIPTIKGR